MEKFYESPEAELTVLRANAATADNDNIGSGGLDTSAGYEDNDRGNA